MRNAIVSFIDLRTRDAQVTVASATAIEDNQQALVLRSACPLGSLWALPIPEQQTGRRYGGPPDGAGLVLPGALVVAGGYSARSSAGHCELKDEPGFHPRGVVVGGCGFGREIWDAAGQQQKRVGDALRPFGVPIGCRVFPVGTQLQRVRTHSNSNPATADAAALALQFRAQIFGRPIILEGQSDYEHGVELLVPGREGLPAAAPDEGFPAEHTKVMTASSILGAALRRAARRQFDRDAVDPMALAKAEAAIGVRFWNAIEKTPDRPWTEYWQQGLLPGEQRAWAWLPTVLAGGNFAGLDAALRGWAYSRWDGGKSGWAFTPTQMKEEGEDKWSFEEETPLTLHVGGDDIGVVPNFLGDLGGSPPATEEIAPTEERAVG